MRRRGPALALISIIIGAVAAAPVSASTIYAGTKGDATLRGTVLQHEGGDVWRDILPPLDLDGDGFADLEVDTVWDLHRHQGDLFACGRLVTPFGFVARWSGAGWVAWTAPFRGSAVTALATAEGELYATTSTNLWVLRGGNWQIVGEVDRIARMTSAECGDAPPRLYMGTDTQDVFTFHDPTGSTSCAAACPPSAPPICGAGCFLGSCIYSMVMHDDGAGPRAHAGAYQGEMYRWDEPSTRFERMPGFSSTGHVQALASHEGVLHAGASDGTLFRWIDPIWQSAADFTEDFPISALATDPETGLLWIGCGGVPFAFGRPSGIPLILAWTATGGLMVAGSGPQLGAGVVALEVMPSATGTCDAGPAQVVECVAAAAGTPGTPVTLTGSASLGDACGAALPSLRWTGGFLEGTATGAVVEVHFPGPGDYDVTLTAATGAATASCGTLVTVQDTIAPLLTVPAPLTLDCDVSVPAPTHSVIDACDESPAVVFDELREDGPCPQSYDLVRTWRATDDAGNASALLSQRIEIRDDTEPFLSGLPPEDATAPCHDVPAPVITAADDCDPLPDLVTAETRVDGPCAHSYDLVRSWTATDDCGNAATATRTLHVSDTGAPALAGVPPDVSASCDAVPAPAAVSAADDCDALPGVAFGESRIDGPCPFTYDLLRTWTATDACGNAATASHVVHVQDDGPPVLAGIPADVTVECTAVPTPATVTASDACDPSPRVAFAESRADGRCPGEYRLTRTWTATDACGNAASAAQVVSVMDTTPPVVEASSDVVDCLWPPNHRMVSFGEDDVRVQASDACSGPVTWRFAGCASDQPDDGLGDGSTEDDCVVAPDGRSFAVRAERTGLDPAGRRYAVTVIATDGCGNSGPATRIGTILVPHDERQRCGR